jgi:hypothetical protein
MVSLAPVDGVWGGWVGRLGSAVGVGVGLLLRTVARVVCWLIFLSPLATVRGGTSFLSVGLGQCRVVAAYVSAGCM